MIYCAYDGSVNAHWVARYALHMAAATAGRALHLVHVEDGRVSDALIARKLAHVVDECAGAGVHASVRSEQCTRSVAHAILEAVGHGPDDLLLCGARARPRDRAFLAGTVSHALLSRPPCNVLALRIVSPGVLGVPRRLLLPVSGNRGEGAALARFVAPLAPEAQEVHFLRVMLTSDHDLRHATPAMKAGWRATGHAALGQVEDELCAAVDLRGLHVDGYVRIAETWSRPALVAAGQHRCDLVLAGTSPPSLADRDGELETLLTHASCDVGIWRVPG